MVPPFFDFLTLVLLSANTKLYDPSRERVNRDEVWSEKSSGCTLRGLIASCVGPMILLSKVERFIRRHRLLQKGDRVLVAVSGGADSVALLHLLAALRHSWQLHIGVAHLDHGLRGKDSEQDAEFVEKLARSLDAACRIERLDVCSLARQKKLGLEEAGRWARQQFLSRMAREHEMDRIALGHQQQDQAETVLHHLMRGSGLRGLGGMPPGRDGLWIRPLLEVTRDEILAFLQEKGYSFRTDASNRDLRFTRNRIRHELIPMLQKEFNPRIVRALAQMALLAREDEAFLQHHSRKAAEKIGSRSPDGFSCRADELAGLPPALQRRMVLAALEEQEEGSSGMTLAHVMQVLDLAERGKSGRRALLPGGLEARRRFDRLILSSRSEPAKPPWVLELNIPGLAVSPEGSWSMEAETSTGRIRNAGSRPETISVAVPAPPGPLILRSWRPGDSYGVRRHRTVKRLWNDARVPLELRGIVPMVQSGTQLIWIPGFPPASLAENGIAETEGTFLHLIFRPRPGSPLARWIFRDRKLDSGRTSL